MKKLSAYSAIALLPLCAFSAATTDPFGAMSLRFPAQSDTYVSLSFHRPHAFQGVVDSVVDTTIVVEGEEIDAVAVNIVGTPGFDENQFISGEDTFYMLVASGPLGEDNQPADDSEEGAWVTVIANDTGALIFDAAEFYANISVPANIEGVTVKVIPFWTPSTLFPDGEGLVANTGTNTDFSLILSPRLPNSSDPESRGILSGINNAARSSYFYFNAQGIEGFFDAFTSQPVDDFFFNPSSFIVVRNQSASDQAVVHVGAVPLSAYRVPVGVLVDGVSQDNPVAFPVPVQMNLDELNLVGSGAITPQTGSTVSGDQLLVFQNAGEGINRAADRVFIYFNDQGITGWFDFFTSAPSDDFEVQPGDALIIRKGPGAASEPANWKLLNPAIKTVSGR